MLIKNYFRCFLLFPKNFDNSSIILPLNNNCLEDNTRIIFFFCKIKSKQAENEVITNYLSQGNFLKKKSNYCFEHSHQLLFFHKEFIIILILI